MFLNCNVVHNFRNMYWKRCIIMATWVRCRAYSCQQGLLFLQGCVTPYNPLPVEEKTIKRTPRDTIGEKNALPGTFSTMIIAERYEFVAQYECLNPV